MVKTKKCMERMERVVAMILITAWSMWTLLTNGDMKPSDNYFLWSLSALSLMYAVANWIVILIKFTDKIRKGN